MPRSDITEGRWSHPFAKRALEETRSVNPSYAEMIEPIGWADYDPNALTVPDIETYLYDAPWQALSLLPGGETTGLAARRNLGLREPYPISVPMGGEAFPLVEPPPTYAHAVSRDAINLATLPMGFLKSIGLGVPADLAADLLSYYATGVDYPETMPERPRGLRNAPAPRARTAMQGWDEYQPPEPRPVFKTYGLRR